MSSKTTVRDSIIALAIKKQNERAIKARRIGPLLNESLNDNFKPDGVITSLDAKIDQDTIRILIEENYHGSFNEEFIEGIGGIFLTYIQSTILIAFEDKEFNLPKYEELEKQFAGFYGVNENYKIELIVFKTLANSETNLGNALELLSLGRTYYDYGARVIKECKDKMDKLTRTFTNGTLTSDEFKDLYKREINKYTMLIIKSINFRNYYSLVLSGLYKVGECKHVSEYTRNLKSMPLSSLLNENNFHEILENLRWEYVKASTDMDFATLCKFSLYTDFVDSAFTMPSRLLNIPVINDEL